MSSAAMKTSSAVAVILLSLFVISSQGAQFYTAPKIHPGSYKTTRKNPSLALYISRCYRTRVINGPLEYFTEYRSIESGFRRGPP